MAETPIVLSKYGRRTPRYEGVLKRWRDARGRFSKPGVTVEQIITTPLDVLLRHRLLVDGRRN